MNTTLHEALARRAKDIDSARLDIDELIGLGERRLRRRRLTAAALSGAAAAGLAIAIAVGGAALNRSTEQTPPVSNEHTGSRPLTYAEGATVHYGQQSVTMPGPVAELDLTDDGVVARTDNGGVWFTDGTGLEQIGTIGDPARSFDPSVVSKDSPLAFGTAFGFVVSGNTGSEVAWLEFVQPTQPELVVYDTASGEEKIRQPLALDAGSAALLASVTDQVAYLYLDPEPYQTDRPNARVDLATGEITPVTPEQYDAEAPAPPPGTARTVLVSHHEGGGGPYKVDEGVYMQLNVVRGGRFEPQGEQPLEVLDGATRAPFTFAAPATATRDTVGFTTQWIDDDSVVIAAWQVDRERGRWIGPAELLICRISTRACEAAGESAHPVLPDVSGIG